MFLDSHQSKEKCGCQNNLGLCYMQGFGVKKDIKKGLYWIKKAAEKGNPESQFAIGEYIFYENEANINEAIFW